MQSTHLTTRRARTRVNRIVHATSTELRGRRAFTFPVIIAIIIIVIIVLIVVALWISSDPASNPNDPEDEEVRCTTAIDAYVSLTAGDATEGNKTVYVCPGDKAYVTWVTVDAESVTLTPSPDLGNVETEGEMALALDETTTIEAEALGLPEVCTDQDEVTIHVVEEGDSIPKTLDAPTFDKESQTLPENAVWSGTISKAFVSPNVVVVRIELVGGCNWNEWELWKTDDDDNVEGSFNLALNGSVDAGVPAVGTWQMVPVGLPDDLPPEQAYAFSECAIEIKLHLACRE